MMLRGSEPPEIESALLSHWPFTSRKLTCFVHFQRRHYSVLRFIVLRFRFTYSAGLCFRNYRPNSVRLSSSQTGRDSSNQSATGRKPQVCDLDSV